MPYPGEHASPVAHSEMLAKLDFTRTLERWEVRARRPVGECPQGLAIRDAMGSADVAEQVVAVDGSLLVVSVDTGHGAAVIQVGVASIALGAYLASAEVHGRPVDRPMLSASVEKDRLYWLLATSGAVPRSGGDEMDLWREDVFHGFRESTVTLAPGVERSLLDGLFVLYGRPGKAAQHVVVPACPHGCRERVFEVGREPLVCGSCKGMVYPTDVLRTHTECGLHGARPEAVQRLMVAAERLVTLLHIEHLYQESPSSLGTTMFFTDGPLAFFGATGPLKVAMGSYWAALVRIATARGLGLPLLVGIEKGGVLVEHVQQIADAFAPGTYCVPDDTYMARSVTNNDTGKPFGADTYYGHHVLYKDLAGQMHVLSVPKMPGESGNRCTYPRLDAVLAQIDTMRSAIHPGALFPVVEAHRVAALPSAAEPMLLEILKRAEAPGR